MEINNTTLYEQLMADLYDVQTTLSHAEVFVSTREKIHKDGQRLYAISKDRLERAINVLEHSLVSLKPSNNTLGEK